MLLPWVPTIQIGARVPGNPTFVDQLGRRVRWNTFHGRARVLAFMYTRCADATECPAISLKFQEMQAHLPPSARLIEVTIDPTHDTPRVLRIYARNFGADPRRWSLLTGDPATVLTFAKRFNVNVSPGNAPGVLVHGEALAIFDRSDRLTSLTAGNSWEPSEVLAELRTADGETGNPLERLGLWLQNFGVSCGAAFGVSESFARPLAYVIAIGMLLFTGAAIVALAIALRAWLATSGSPPAAGRR